MKILTSILILSCCFFAPLYPQELEYKERATSTVQGQESQAVLNDINNLSFLVKRSASWYNAVWPKPDHYEYIQKDSLPVRWDITCFPLKIYSKPVFGNKSKAYYQFICQATSIWNGVAQDIGLGVDFFKPVHDSLEADIRVDWSGRYVPLGAVGIAKLRLRIIGMLPKKQYKNKGEIIEMLLHELCHLLGVKHSKVADDIMFELVHSHEHEPSEVKASTRDRQMLAWLYAVKVYHSF